MKKAVLKSWSFVHVFQLALDLAREGGVDLSSADFLRKITNVRTWEALDELARDPKHLGRLTPPLATIYRAAVQAGVAEEIAARLYASAVIAENLIEKSLGEVGYAWLSRRQLAHQLIYALAAEIQGYPHVSGLDDRQERSEAFLMEFYEYGLGNPDEMLREEIESYERQLGVLFCLRAVTVLTEHPELHLEELVRQGLMKYGMDDIRGRRVCYWCSGCPCVCGGRKGGKKAALPGITTDFVWSRGLPEMDRHMVVYGVGRNSAISALAGVVRSFSEDGGEYGWVDLASRSRGTSEGIRERQGCLYLAGTRHPRMSTKKAAEGVPLIESLYSEAADAVVSWPCLVTQAFGLSFVRSVKRGLEHMAANSGVAIEMPRDLTQTILATRT